MKCATHRQIGWIEELVRQKKLTTERLQELRESGFLDTLLESAQGNLEVLNPFELARALGHDRDYVPWGPRITLDVSRNFPLTLGESRLDSSLRHIEETVELADCICPRKSKVRFLAVNRRGFAGSLDTLQEHLIRPCNRFELLALARDVPRLNTRIERLRVHALGTCFNPDAAPHKRKYPFIYYYEGCVLEFGRVSGNDVVTNCGYRGFYRDLFLCSFDS